jgi:N-acetylglucosamine malate deacetylase 1
MHYRLRVFTILLLAAIVVPTPTSSSHAADGAKPKDGGHVRLDETTCGAEKSNRTRESVSDAKECKQGERKLRIVFFGAHCDDNEIGAGGLMRLLANRGHEVISAYATTFRRGRTCDGKPEDEVRRAEATAACKLLGATPHFFPYAHEDLEKPLADSKTLSEIGAWLQRIKPDVVVTHWPIDEHANHCSVAAAVIGAYRHLGPGWNLYFYENLTFTNWDSLGSLGFRPNLYLDITDVRESKRQAVAVFKSQAQWNLWDAHDNMHVERGKECGVKYAEAFFLVEAKPGCPLLPLLFQPAKNNKVGGPEVLLQSR